MPPDILAQLNPSFIVPLVAVLVHPSNKKENGSIFEIGGGHVAKVRWERAKGLLLKPDDTMTPGSILKGWDQVKNFSEPFYPSGPAKFMDRLESAMKLPGNDPAEKIDFKGKVAVITGGGAGCVVYLFLPEIHLTNALVVSVEDTASFLPDWAPRSS